jgi:hypothetical protein
MVEFLLMLPIMLIICGMAIFLSMGMRAKEESQIQVRHDLWYQMRRRGWHHYDSGRRQDGTWTAWDPDANGAIGDGASTGTENRPRGTGDELDYLYDNAGHHAMGVTNNPVAEDYYRRLWNNLPGRHHRADIRSFETGAPMYRWIDRTQRDGKDERIQSHYWNDSPSWWHGQLPPWLIAQYGPVKEIRETFERHLEDQTIPVEFRRMTTEVLHAWFAEERLRNWNNPNVVIPQ